MTSERTSPYTQTSLHIYMSIYHSEVISMLVVVYDPDDIRDNDAATLDCHGRPAHYQPIYGYDHTLIPISRRPNVISTLTSSLSPGLTDGPLGS